MIIIRSPYPSWYDRQKDMLPLHEMVASSHSVINMFVFVLMILCSYLQILTVGDKTFAFYNVFLNWSLLCVHMRRLLCKETHLVEVQKKGKI